MTAVLLSPHRACLRLITSVQKSMGLSMKAVSVVLCCIMMILPATSFNKSKRTPIDEKPAEPPHKRAPSAPTSSIPELCCHYRTLMIEPDAEVCDIKRVHREMAVRYHPDKNSDASSQDMFIRAQEAYETLSDLTKRRAYDTKMHHHFQQYHSAPRSCDESTNQPACDTFGSQQKSLRRPRVVGHYFFNNNTQQHSSSLLLPSRLSSWVFILLCASLFVLVVFPSVMIILYLGAVLSISSSTYRYLRASALSP